MYFVNIIILGYILLLEQFGVIFNFKGLFVNNLTCVIRGKYILSLCLIVVIGWYPRFKKCLFV